MAAIAPVSGAFVARASAFAGRKVQCSASNGTTGKVSARASWFPGSDIPEYLDGSAPCDYGFDPLGLGKVPSNFERFQEAELLHCRWAMLGTAGCWGVEALGFGTWQDAPLKALGGNETYFGKEIPIPLPALAGIEFFVMAYIESARSSETDRTKRMYPGGSFDPAGFAKDPKEFEVLKRKEIANGRLAMVAFLGILMQSAANGMGPVEAWAAHVADPWHVSAAQNVAAVPFA